MRSINRVAIHCGRIFPMVAVSILCIATTWTAPPEISWPACAATAFPWRLRCRKTMYLRLNSIRRRVSTQGLPCSRTLSAGTELDKPGGQFDFDSRSHLGRGLGRGRTFRAGRSLGDSWFMAFPFSSLSDVDIHQEGEIRIPRIAS